MKKKKLLNELEDKKFKNHVEMLAPHRDPMLSEFVLTRPIKICSFNSTPEFKKKLNDNN